MFNRIKKFTALDRDERKLFLEAYITLGIMRFLILTIPFKWLTRFLVQSPADDIHVSPLNPLQQPVVSAVARSIYRAAAHTPWESVCLPQALTAHRMLARRRVQGRFYLGLRKNAKGAEPLEAHAWSQAGNIVVTGGRGVENFTVVSVFTWGQS